MNDLQERLEVARRRAREAVHPARLPTLLTLRSPRAVSSLGWLWSDAQIAQANGVPIEEFVALAEAAARDTEDAMAVGRRIGKGEIVKRAWWVLRCADCRNRPVAAVARVDRRNLLWVRAKRGDLFRWVPSAGASTAWAQCPGEAPHGVDLDDLEGRGRVTIGRHGHSRV